MNVEPVVAPPPGNPRFPLFDGLRAVAVFSVLITHTALFSGANELAWYGIYTSRLDVGVTIFFVISGFLLYRPFVAARLEDRPQPRIRDYARRRFLRIVPAYWLALTVLAIYPGLQQVWSGHSWAYYLLVQNYKPVWTIGGLGPAWSLSVEAAFYVSLPLIAIAMWRIESRLSRAGRIRAELILVTILFSASIAIRATAQGSTLHVTLPGAFDWFAIGMLLAIVSAALAGTEPAPVRLLRRYPSAAWICAGVLFWVSATQLGLAGHVFFRVTTLQNTAEHLVYGAIAFFFVLPAVFADDGGGFPRAVLRNRVVAWLGLISYGIFLWHHPIAGKLTSADHQQLFASVRMLGITATTIVLSIAIAALSYYGLERPILRYKDRPFGRRRPGRVGGASEVSGTAG